MNLQCFSKLFSNCNFFKLISSQQQDSKQIVLATPTKEELGEQSTEAVCQDGVCSLSGWRPRKSA
jgi:hypothetical protein